MLKENSKKEKPEVVEDTSVYSEDNVESSLDKETLLNTKEKELNIFAEQLKEKDEDIKKRETSLSEREKELEEREKALIVSSTQDNTLTLGLEFTFQGVRKKFSDDAPKTIRLEGGIWTQEELIKNEELLAELVDYNSGLIENIIE